jgi:hypothetical protein
VQQCRQAGVTCDSLHSRRAKSTFQRIASPVASGLRPTSAHPQSPQPLRAAAIPIACSIYRMQVLGGLEICTPCAHVKHATQLRNKTHSHICIGMRMYGTNVDSQRISPPQRASVVQQFAIVFWYGREKRARGRTLCRRVRSASSWQSCSTSSRFMGYPRGCGAGCEWWHSRRCISLSAYSRPSESRKHILRLDTHTPQQTHAHV